MATQTIALNPDTVWLRRVLQADGVFEAVSGAVLLAGAVPGASFLDSWSPALLVASGASLLGYAAWLFRVAAPECIQLRHAVIAATLNTGSVAAGAGLLLSNQARLTGAGRSTVAAGLVIVGTFAILQFAAVQRARGAYAAS